MLAGIPILDDATVVANVSVMDEEVDGLIVIMLCAGVVDVGQLVKGKLAIAFGGTEHVLASIAAGGQIANMLQALMASVAGVALVQAAPERHLL